MPHLQLLQSTPQPWTVRRVPKSGADLRILVVDDNPNGALALAAYLSLDGIECRTAFSGREATLAGTAWRPHIILMNISMPECNGFEVTHALRQGPRTGETVIIAYTALDETEVRRPSRGTN
ncbi:response regulator [Caballeronia grimmiae]|uniref:response regulator n=1 Tax=Caballeronia grimmiae TaxID=1071679 RepID=UPI0038BC2398